MSSGKRGHNAWTQARNSRGQFTPAREVYLVDSDTNVDSDPAAMRLALEVRVTGGKHDKGAASSGGNKKVSVSRNYIYFFSNDACKFYQ
jgi:phage baseplate assembly protein gpV